MVLKEFGYVFPALLISCLDIASNSVWRWDFGVGVTCREEIDKFGVRHNACRAIAFRDPFCNVRTVGCELEEIYQQMALTGTQALSAHNESM